MRTVIIGNSGSGKTWLAKRLGERANVPIVHLDELFWQPGGFDLKRSESEIAGLIETMARGESWIVEGVFGDLAARFLSEASGLVWLDLPWPVCKRRLEARGSESKAHMKREQSEGGLRKLIEWAAEYCTRTGPCSKTGHRAIYRSFPGNKFFLTTEAEVVTY